MSHSFESTYSGRRVLVTGHTGFKGTWLASWLIKLGAEVTGVSKGIPTSPSMFEDLGLSSKLNDIRLDVRDLDALADIVGEGKPDFIFHLAAQAIVSTSYTDPVETVTTNAIGSMNVLEALRRTRLPSVAVMITSDKCYENVEWEQGYRESDILGGKDVYSASKAAAEIVIRSYVRSFFPADGPARVVVGRAGNVIGGGDWSTDRIVPDSVRAWGKNQKVSIRSPNATRPWQHVLEPLSGYLLLGQAARHDAKVHGEPFNFGPKDDQTQTVLELLKELSTHWGYESVDDSCVLGGDRSFHEANLLRLNCEKARSQLGWQPTLDYREAVGLVADWYRAYQDKTDDMYEVTLRQIGEYEILSSERNRNGGSDGR
ncbi:MAG: CDP-glucose 4,6-dehydratase [Gemmatimonadaceae bacterium]|nr:CDP-glucose 4,6-dehydratase [Gemmatimonadaceae bacterium]